jgi:hypothetical protein
MSQGDADKTYNDELHNLYSSPNTITVIKDDDMVGTCSHIRKYEIWATQAHMTVQ